MLVQDIRTPSQKIVGTLGIILLGIVKTLWFILKNLCLGWAMSTVLLQKPKKWDILTKVVIFQVGRNALLGKTKKSKTVSYLRGRA